MKSHDRPHDGQAQTRRTRSLRARDIAAEVAVEDAPELFGGDDGSGILDGNRYVILVLGHDDFQRPTTFRVSDAVRNEVAHRPLDERRVRADTRLPAHLQRYACLFRHAAEVFGDFVQGSPDVHSLGAQRELRIVRACQEERTFDKARQTLVFLYVGFEHRVILVEAPRARHRDLCLDQKRVDRGPKVVRQVRRESGQAPHAVFKPVEHRVERAGELPQLLRRLLDVQACIEPPAADFVGLLCHDTDWHEAAPYRVPAQSRSDQSADDSSQHQIAPILREQREPLR